MRIETSVAQAGGSITIAADNLANDSVAPRTFLPLVIRSPAQSP